MISMNEKMTQLETVDVALNRADKNRRVFYFLSENREIDSKVLDYSGEMWIRIRKLRSADIDPACMKVFEKGLRCSRPRWPKGESPFDYLRSRGLLREWNSKYAGMNIVDSNGKKEIRMQDKNYPAPVCWYMRDFHQLSETERGVQIKSFLDSRWADISLLLVSSCMAMIPTGLGDCIELIRIKPINQREIRDILRDFLYERLKGRANFESVMLTDGELDKASACLLGFSEAQLAPLLEDLYSMGSEGVFRKGDLRALKMRVSRERRVLAEKDGTLCFDEEEAVATGMEAFMDWFNCRRAILEDDAISILRGIPPIRGVAMTGLPGTGKTEMARTVRDLLQIPMVVFNFTKMQSSEYGKAGNNLLYYLDKVESIGRCVLIIDEVEKIFHKEKPNGQRMHEAKEEQMGELMKWMQRQKDALIFMTSNCIQDVPDALIRDTRINERFYAFLPAASELAQILNAHLRRLNDRSGGRLFSAELVRALGDGGGDKGSLAQDVIRELLRRACDGRGKEDIFMTGANVVKLLENTNLSMMNRPVPYGLEEYKRALIECASSEDFIPIAESKPESIVDAWLYTREERYVCVSKNKLLNASGSEFENGRFSDDFKKSVQERIKGITAGANTGEAALNRMYAAWFAHRFIPRIEKRANNGENR